MSVYRPKYTEIDPKTGETTKESPTYWYEFVFRGKRYRERTLATNRREAERLEAAKKTQVANGEVGIEERAPAPTLREFAGDFMNQIRMDCASKPRTIAFYQEKLNQILAHGAMADRSLDRIDEDAIEAYKRA